jgi:polyphosphate kinase
VELLVPIQAAEHRRKLDELLDLYVNDPTAWVLAPDGEYARRSRDGEAAQDRLVRS